MTDPLNVLNSTILTAAIKRAPFSNGTEGEVFENRWCATCTRQNVDADIYCPLWDVALLDGVTPAQWEPSGTMGRYSCTEYRRRPGSPDARG